MDDVSDAYRHLRLRDLSGMNNIATCFKIVQVVLNIFNARPI